MRADGGASVQDGAAAHQMPADCPAGSLPLEGSESVQMRRALSSRLLRSGMPEVMSDLAVTNPIPEGEEEEEASCGGTPRPDSGGSAAGRARAGAALVTDSAPG
jgi:hypothetical protein